MALAAAACAGGPRRRDPPEPALRLWTPGIVHWTAGERRLRIAVENGTSRIVRVEAPAARRTRVVLYDGAGPDRVCGQDADPSGPAEDAVALEPGELRAVAVDLEAACGALPAGEYRYEIGYEAPAAGPGPPVRLRTIHGHVVVQGESPGTLDRGSLGSGRGGGDAPGPRVSPRGR